MAREHGAALTHILGAMTELSEIRNRILTSNVDNEYEMLVQIYVTLSEKFLSE